MLVRWICVIFLVGCKNATPVESSPTPGSATAPPPRAAASWTIESQPIELPCGDKPLALPAAVAAAKKPTDAPLARSKTLGICQNQASIAAACTCLATSASELGLGKRADCTPLRDGDDNARIVRITTTHDDGATTSGGEAYVLVGKRGTAWSPIAVVEEAAEVDLAETPKASTRAAIKRVQPEPIPNGTLYWIESQSETQETATGERDHDGVAHGSVCVIGDTAFCYAPLQLGTWEYSLSLANSTCTTRRIETYWAAVEPSMVRIALAHGTETLSVVGQHKL